MFLAMPIDHPLAHKRNLRLADLADDPWIAGTTDCECNRLINRACAVAGFEPRIAFQTDDYTAMQGFVAAGVGVSLIAELGLTSIRDDIVVRSLGRETPVREVYAATALDAHRTPATLAMLEILAGRRVPLRDAAARSSSSSAEPVRVRSRNKCPCLGPGSWMPGGRPPAREYWWSFGVGGRPHGAARRRPNAAVLSRRGPYSTGAGTGGGTALLGDGLSPSVVL